MSSLDEKIARAQAAQSTRPIHKETTYGTTGWFVSTNR